MATNNVLRFLVRLQANEGNVHSVINKTVRQLDQIKTRASEVGGALKRAFSPSALGSSLMAIPGMQFLTNPYTLLAAGVGAVTKLGVEAEKTAIAFTTLTGSESKANALLKDIGKFADSTPFGKMELAENARTLMNFGVETDKVVGHLRRLGDISGGDGEKLKGLSLVFGQVQSSGKLMGQDLMQFINQGFNPLKELQKMTGKSYSELQEMMSKGQITAKNVEQAILNATTEGGQFHGMMEALSKSAAGKWSTAVGNLQTVAADAFTHIQPHIISIIDGINEIMPYITSVVNGVFSFIGGVIGAIAKYRSELLLFGGIVLGFVIAIKGYSAVLLVYQGVVSGVSMATKIWAGVQWLLNAAMSANPIGIVIGVIVALAAGVTYCWNEFAGFRAFILTMWDVLKGFGTIIKEFVINRFNDLLSGIGEVGEALKLLFNGDFAAAADKATSAVSKISGANAVANAYRASAELTNQVGKTYTNHLAKENAKSNAKSDTKATISKPGLSGSAEVGTVEFGSGKVGKGKKGKGGKKGKTSSEIATGGQRNTSIVMNIRKFFDNIYVTMNDKSDTAELERIVLQSINRALAIATSTE